MARRTSGRNMKKHRPRPKGRNRKPKRSGNPYMNFLADFRKYHDKLDHIEVIRRGAAAWRDLNPSDKKVYQDEALKFRKPPEMRPKKVYCKETINPYINFLMDFRKTCSNMDNTSIVKSGANIWRTMDTEKKKPYIDMAQTAKKKKGSSRILRNKSKNKKVKPKMPRSTQCRFKPKQKPKQKPKSKAKAAQKNKKRR